MDYTLMAFTVVGLLTCIGIIFGFILAFADKKFAMEENPLIGEVEEALPKGQCGACGFPGCAKYAEAVVLDPNVPPNLCVPGKKEVAAIVAQLTGKVAEETEPQYAHIRCRGGNGIAKLAYEYKGIHDCAAAKIIQQGPKFCKFGCLGFGNCVRACPFGAMTMGENGLPHVDKNLCTGCGKCASICPNHVIDLLPMSAKVSVSCSSKDFGAPAMKNCKALCLGCGSCMRNCSHKDEGAIKIVEHLAVINQDVCHHCDNATCLTKCPTGAINEMIKGVFKPEEKKEETAG